MIKQRETEQTKPADIQVRFDFDEIERSSIMQSYNDILPFAETMQVVIDGSEYVVLDQYCVKTRCGCKDAHLNLLPIKEGGGVLESRSSANVNYHTRTWEPVEDEPLPCAVATFRTLIECNVSDLYAKLRARHEKALRDLCPCTQARACRCCARPCPSVRGTQRSVSVRVWQEIQDLLPWQAAFEWRCPPHTVHIHHSPIGSPVSAQGSKQAGHGASPPRDFVPWRFSDAGQSMLHPRRCRRPRKLHNAQ